MIIIIIDIRVFIYPSQTSIILYIPYYVFRIWQKAQAHAKQNVGCEQWQGITNKP